jgi:hypothetical protein
VRYDVFRPTLVKSLFAYFDSIGEHIVPKGGFSTFNGHRNGRPIEWLRHHASQGCKATATLTFPGILDCSYYSLKESQPSAACIYVEMSIHHSHSSDLPLRDQWPDYKSREIMENIPSVVQTSGRKHRGPFSRVDLMAVTSI